MRADCLGRCWIAVLLWLTPIVAAVPDTRLADAVKNRDTQTFHARVREAIGECVRKQIDTGLDIVNDGEWSKPDYSTYVKNRFTGFEGEPTAPDTSRDMLDFPEFAPYRRTGLPQLTRPKCNGPIAWKDFDAVRRDIANLKAAAGNAAEVFMTAVSPGQVARFQGNSYYKSDEEYLWALANVLKDEYKAITDAGFTLQLDCPDLGSGWNGQFRSLTLAEFRKVVDLHLEVLNAAITLDKGKPNSAFHQAASLR